MIVALTVNIDTVHGAVREITAAKGPTATDDYADMETSAGVEVGATVLDAKGGEAQVCWGG